MRKKATDDKYMLKIKESEIDYFAGYSGYVYVFFKKPFEISQPPVVFVNEILPVK